MKKRMMLTLFWVILPLTGLLAGKVGAYQSIAVGDMEAKAAADFAVGAEGKKSRKQLTLKSIEEAQKQIVAGTNFQLLLLVNKGTKERKAKVVVFRGLDQHFELKTWDWQK